MLHEEWMFVAPLSCPTTHVNDQPVYIDPLAYVGIMNVNHESLSWPQTAGHDVVARTPLDILKQACKYDRLAFEKPPEPEVAVEEEESEKEPEPEEAEGEEKPTEEKEDE